MRVGAWWPVVVGVAGAMAIAACGDGGGDRADAAPPNDAQEPGPYELPAPTGPHAIGTDVRLLTDASRLEPQTSDPDDVRRLVVQLWYPAEAAAAGSPIPYMTTDEAAVISSGEARFYPGWQDDVVFHARTGVPFVPDGQRHPVLLASHGFGAPRQFYTALIEEVVSHGYVVAAISHLYDSSPVELPDGTVLGTGPFLDGSPTSADLDAHISVWSADAGFVIDQLEAIDGSDPILGGRLDLTRIGMYGHSYGGTASADLSVLDPRLDAGIDLDGSIFGDTADGSPAIPIPYMIMRSHADATYGPVLAALTVGYDVSLAGARHASYGDVAMILENIVGTLPISEFGRIDPLRAITIIRAYVLAFFDKHLLGQDPTLLDGSESPYPEITVSQIP